MKVSEEQSQNAAVALLAMSGNNTVASNLGGGPLGLMSNLTFNPS